MIEVPDELVDILVSAVFGVARKSETDLVVRGVLERNWKSLVYIPIHEVGYQDGYQSGFEDGQSDGYDTGYDDALNENL